MAHKQRCNVDKAVSYFSERPAAPLSSCYYRLPSRQAQFRHTLAFNIQDAQLSQRDRAAGCVIALARSGKLELGDNILQTL